MGAADFTTMLFVGAGAVEGAWKPVLEAVHSIPDFDRVVTSDAANAAMARIVYLMRAFAIANKEPALTEVRRTYDDLRGRICRALVDAESNGALRARPALKRVVKRFARGVGAVISTNWDRACDEALGMEAVHIHGLAAQGLDGVSLYLPTELVREPYRAAAEASALAAAHRNAMEALGKADRFVVYGLSLSSLDAELLQIISSASTSSPLRDVHIVDLRAPEVAERFATLLPHSIPISCYHPDALDAEWRFSPDALEEHLKDPTAWCKASGAL